MIVTARQLLLTGVLAWLAGGTMTLAAVAQSVPGQLDVAPAAEPPAPQPPAAAPPAPPAPPLQIQPGRSRGPGLFGTIGRWFDDSLDTMTSGWNATVGSLGDRASDAAKGARDAATSVRIPGPVMGRQPCPVTASGGPDCQAATDALCRSKGFSAGTSLHIQSEQKCPVWGWIAGKEPTGHCGTATYVTSAMCR